MKKLVRCVVDKIEVATDGTWIRFHVGNETLTYYAEGDCCSRSWIESITGAGAIVGSTVEKFEEIDLPGETVLDDDGWDEYLQVYGYKLTTSRGVMVIDFRNVSNGYYGGSLLLAASPNPQHWPIPPDGWVEVTEDWSCSVGPE